jgi:predicted DNA repair protein MutK
MAAGSLLLLLDDSASVLDDVATMTKVAARKTAGVLGDDLAVNAEKVTGVRAERELPVVWAVAKGSFRNKLILVPVAMALALLASWAIVPALMLGGLYLCFEGFEKLTHSFAHGSEAEKAHRAELRERVADPAADLVQLERARVRGAIRTDFILSAEIIVLTLGVVADKPFLTQLLVVSGIAIVMTVGVYGLVAGIVKLDDAGLYLTRREGSGAWSSFLRWLGGALLVFAPWLMKALSIVGTVAMFMVGGGILVHNLHLLETLVATVGGRAGDIPGIGGLLAWLTPTLGSMLVGVIAGAVVLAVVSLWQRLRPGAQPTS